jgi:hypothetical protein
MGFSEKPVVWTDREPTLDEEIGAFGDEDIFDMANLVESQTGVPRNDHNHDGDGTARTPGEVFSEARPPPAQFFGGRRLDPPGGRKQSR